MAKKKIRRSEAAYRRKMLLVWIIALFFLALLVLLDAIIVYNQMHPVNRALSEPVDYSFRGAGCRQRGFARNPRTSNYRFKLQLFLA